MFRGVFGRTMSLWRRPFWTGMELDLADKSDRQGHGQSSKKSPMGANPPDLWWATGNLAVWSSVIPVLLMFVNASHETVTAARDRGNISILFSTLAENFSQDKDILRKIRFLYECIRPYRLHQLILRDHLSTVLNEDKQYLQGFLLNRD